ncbi:uncharacterized protein LOC111255432 isoform X2 [Varroa destructor]|uniref:Ig-like domain-containing protein n=1 Tax=Varroa destructor TaxID=109461 RepID=A0A7M7L2Y1_VARDE|nr:uncharacterized protein LOC111255432 isoform X2 [Varroa destructor]
MYCKYGTLKRDKEVIYRLDGRRGINARGVFASPHHVTSPAWTGRSYFSLARQPATLKIARLELSDSDEYTCEVQHADGTTLTHRLVFTVIHAPKVQVSIRGGHDSLAVNEGDDVYLECTFSANPEPHTILWYHDSRLLPEYLVPITTGPYLILKGARPEHSGNYTCSVANLLGNATSGPANLQVKYRPRCVSLWRSPSVASLLPISKGVANPLHAQKSSIGQDIVDEIRIGCELDCDDGATCDFIWDVFDEAGVRMNIQPHSEEPVKATTQSRSRLAEFSIPRRYSQQPLRIECRGKNRIGVTKIQPCSLEIPSVAGGNENQCVLSWGDTRRLRKASDPLLVRCPLKEGRPQQWRRPDQSNEVQLSDYGTGHTYVLEILNELGHVVDHLVSPEPRFALEAGSRWREGSGEVPQMEKLLLRIVIPSLQTTRTVGLQRSVGGSHSNRPGVKANAESSIPFTLCCSARGKDLAQMLLKPRSEPLATSNAFTYGGLKTAQLHKHAVILMATCTVAIVSLISR